MRFKSENWPNQDPIQEAGGLNLYDYVANDPIDYFDPTGLFNPLKGLSALVNASNAGRLYASGFLKLGVGAAFDETVIGAPIGVGAGALGAWNIFSGNNTYNRATKLWKEAWNEDSSAASLRNLLGILPFGTEYDDPCEPSMWQVLKKKANQFAHKPWEFLQEIGSLMF